MRLLQKGPLSDQKMNNSITSDQEDVKSNISSHRDLDLASDLSSILHNPNPLRHMGNAWLYSL